MQGVSVVRDDGARGTVVAGEEHGQILVQFNDGSRASVPPEALLRQQDGTYRLSSDQMVIPVVAEELTIEKERVERARVHVRKRVETREEVVDAPVTREEVVIEHVAVNKFVEDRAPQEREEDGVQVIPIFEEVLVVEKRLFLREELRISKRRTTTNTPQTVVLRREVVDVERDEV